MPPSTPSRGLRVWRASSAPFSTPSSSSQQPSVMPARARFSASRRRGPPVTAHLPGGQSRPCRVQRPIPSTARKMSTAAPASMRWSSGRASSGAQAERRAKSTAPCVQSGSSPPSLTISAMRPGAGGRMGRRRSLPSPNSTGTTAGGVPVRRDCQQATASAAAQAPVE